MLRGYFYFDPTQILFIITAIPSRKRIGYDGTTQTPSKQLLKPTASSRGHQVCRPSIQSSPKKTTNDISSNIYSSFNDHQRHGCASGVIEDPFHSEGIENDTKKLAYTIQMNPFGEIGKSITTGSGSVTSEEEDAGTMIGLMSPTNNSANAALEEGLNNHRGDNSTSRTGLHRRASWSQGSKHQPQRKRGFSGSCKEDYVSICPERLRSFIIDPVASQLLRECAVHDDDDDDEHDYDSVPLLSYSTASEADPSVGGEEANPLCHKGSFFRYSSMPDLRSDPHTNRDGVLVPPQTKEASSSVNTYPLSPEPLIRSVSDRLLDVKTEDDIKSLARPIPRKFSVSSVACCAPLPRRFDA